jgi:hypothetical protein
MGAAQDSMRPCFPDRPQGALAFAHAAAFAPSDAANTALVSSTSPSGQTPFAHTAASAGAGRL